MKVPRLGARTGISIAAVALVGAAGLLLVRTLEGRSGPSELVTAPSMLTEPLDTPISFRPDWMAGVIAVAVDQPDGRAIALLGLDETGGTGVLARAFDDIDGMAWSPDGERLAFAARRGANWDLYVVPRSGGEPARLTNHPAFDGWPAWSPDGSLIAFESARDGELAVYQMDVASHVGLGAGQDLAAGTGVAANAGLGSGQDPAIATGLEPAVTRLSPADAAGPAIEPTWSPDGTRVVYSVWDGELAVYRLDAVDVASGETLTLLAPEPAPEHVPQQAAGSESGQASEQESEPPPVIDKRAAAFSTDGALVYREAKYGEGSVRAVDPNSDSGSSTTLAARVNGFALAPGGDAIVFLTPGRRSSTLEVRGLDVEDAGRWSLAELGPDTETVAWGSGTLPAGLPAVQAMADGERFAVGRGGGVASLSLGAAAAVETRPGLVRIDDINVSGPRINAAIKADFDALRAEIRAATGSDFLGTLSDMWRPIGFDSSRSAFYSWHKTGRAFDTFMSFTTAGGGDGMVLVREGGGRPMWRMYLWAAVQDGSVGEPIREPGWRFSTSGWDEEHELREGGSRALRVPGGYWVDFTAAATRYGWHRIPAISRPGFDWRESFSAIEFWHYERRDGLSWREAISEVYEPEMIEEALRGAPPRRGGGGG